MQVEYGDMLEVIPRLAAGGMKCDSCVTDPPYGIGFMNKKWDNTVNIAFCPDTWKIVASILKPGSFLLAFGGTRTNHRMACAIEDAGFVIQDCVMWLYGNGSPKGKHMLKPAWEPIIVAYKPGGKREMQIAECRIPGSDAINRTRHGGGTGGTWGDFTRSTANNKHSLPDGRWPANVCHDGSAEVEGLFPITVRGGSAARFFYSAKANKYDRAGSNHPTVKPVSLMQWLVSLVTPPGGTILDPFAGSGTTGQAAAQAGRNALLIEREAEYIADIHRRNAEVKVAAWV